MRRLLFVVLLALLAVAPLQAEPFVNNDIDATATSQTISITGAPRTSVCIRGAASGDNEVFYRLFADNETPAAATDTCASCVRLEPTESDCYTFDSQGSEGRNTGDTGQTPTGYIAVSFICSAAETASNLRLVAK